MRKCAVSWPSKHDASVEIKPVFLLICISLWTLQSESYGSPPVFCQQHSGPCNYHLFPHKGFVEERLSFPGSLNKSILLSGFPPTTKKKLPSIFATHVLHHWIVLFTSFWIGCVCHCLGETTGESKQPHKAPITASTFPLCVCVKSGKTYDGIAIVISGV